MKLLLTAGYDGAPHVIALAELLRRARHEIVAVMVVSPYSVARGRQLLVQRGRKGFVGLIWRALGAKAPKAGQRDHVAELLRENAITERSLRRWCESNRASFHTVKNLNAPKAIHLLHSYAPQGVIYGGGGILKDEFLAAAAGCVLNAHSGPLPQIRGMNACEWSVLLGLAPEVTIHFIARGIDTGAVVERIAVPVNPTDSIATLRAKCVRLGIEGLARKATALLHKPPLSPPHGGRHRQCFVMAPVLLELLEARFADGIAVRHTP